MGGGGTIIIRRALRQALMEPVVRGALPQYQQTRLAHFIYTDESLWTDEQTHDAAHAFGWYVATIC